MKKRLVLAILLLPATVVAAGEEDLVKAFQREYAALAAQKEALQRAARQSETDFSAKRGAAEREIKELERKLVRAVSANDALFEEVQTLEKERREQTNRDASTASTLKKALKSLAEQEKASRFESPERSEPVLPEPMSLAAFDDVRRRSMDLLRASASVSEARVAYRGKDGTLREGSVKRIGRIAAWVTDGSSLSVLGPDGEGHLQEVDRVTASKSGLWPVYLFEALSEKAVVKKPATVLDRVADLAPAVLLGLLFAMVGALFLVLARE